jgi:hypothetical protein
MHWSGRGSSARLRACDARSARRRLQGLNHGQVDEAACIAGRRPPSQACRPSPWPSSSKARSASCAPRRGPGARRRPRVHSAYAGGATHLLPLGGRRAPGPGGGHGDGRGPLRRWRPRRVLGQAAQSQAEAAGPCALAGTGRHLPSKGTGVLLILSRGMPRPGASSS